MSQDRCSRVTDLLVRVGEGDLEALAELYDDLGAAVFAVVCRAVRGPGLPADVTQDVFLRVWREARTFDPSSGSGWAWIYAVATQRGTPEVRDRAARR